MIRSFSNKILLEIFLIPLHFSGGGEHSDVSVVLHSFCFLCISGLISPFPHSSTPVRVNHPSLPGVGPTEVRQPGFPDSGGLQHVEAGVDVDPDPLRGHLGMLSGHGGQVQRAGGRVCLPGPEEESQSARQKVTMTGQ